MCLSATYGIFLDVFIIRFFQNVLKSDTELKLTLCFQKKNSHISNASKQIENFSNATLFQECPWNPVMCSSAQL